MMFKADKTHMDVSVNWHTVAGRLLAPALCKAKDKVISVVYGVA